MIGLGKGPIRAVELPVGIIIGRVDIEFRPFELIDAGRVVENGGGVVGFGHKGVALGHGRTPLLKQGKARAPRGRRSP